MCTLHSHVLLIIFWLDVWNCLPVAHDGIYYLHDCRSRCEKFHQILILPLPNQYSEAPTSRHLTAPNYAYTTTTCIQSAIGEACTHTIPQCTHATLQSKTTFALSTSTVTLAQIAKVTSSLCTYLISTSNLHSELRSYNAHNSGNHCQCYTHLAGHLCHHVHNTYGQPIALLPFSHKTYITKPI